MKNGDSFEDVPIGGSPELIQSLSQIFPVPRGSRLSRMIPQGAPVSASIIMEESLPPSPQYGPPANFGEVFPGLYRSSFPKEPNFEHLAQLELRTILTLVSEDYDDHYLKFIKSQGIKHHQIQIPPNKEAFTAIPLEAMTQALALVSDLRNYPMLVHCNKGKHRTGCVIGCYRKMNDWKMDAIIDEYRHYAGAKARSLDEKYISEFDHYGMAMRLSDAAYRSERQATGLPTPPASDKSYTDGLFKENDPNPTNSKAPDQTINSQFLRLQ